MNTMPPCLRHAQWQCRPCGTSGSAAVPPAFTAMRTVAHLLSAACQSVWRPRCAEVRRSHRIRSGGRLRVMSCDGYGAMASTAGTMTARRAQSNGRKRRTPQPWPHAPGVNGPIIPSSLRKSDASVVVPHRTSPRSITSGPATRNLCVSNRQPSESGRVNRSRRKSHANVFRGGLRLKTVMHT